MTREVILQIQVEEILKHKWIMSENHGQDIGNKAVMDWIDEHAADFREYWVKKLAEMVDEKIDENS